MSNLEEKDLNSLDSKFAEIYIKSISEKELIASKYQEKSEVLAEEIFQITEKLNASLKDNNELSAKINKLELELHRISEKNYNLQQSMSYRLGYSLLVGFKSWKNFKNLLKTIKQLIQEKKGLLQRKKYISQNREGDLGLIELNYPKNLINTKKYFQYWVSEKKKSDNFVFNKNLIVTEEFVKNKKYLDKKGLNFIIEKEACVDRVIRVCVKAENTTEIEKQAILTIDYLDERGESLQAIIDTPYSPSLKKYYHYLSVNPELYNNILICPPQETASIELSVRLWDNIEPIKFDGLFQICELKAGVSIVIPSYKGEDTIIRCLSSIANQNFDLKYLEVILVLNGERDSTRSKVEKFIKRFPQLSIQFIESENKGASSARNEGLKAAKFNFVTYIDDDDYIDRNYILNLYASSGYDHISITGVSDVIDQTGNETASTITQQITNAVNRGKTGYNDVTSVLTMNSCKLIPSYMAKSQLYNETLKSGEDVVYWTKLIADFQPTIEITKAYDSAVYYRVVTSNSVSRQAESFDFNVLQRLDVITQLISIKTKNVYDESFVQSKILAQSNFIKRYLLKHPEDYKKFQKEIINRKIVHSFISDINALFTKRLVISYCFAPYADTSAVVMSKRINQMDSPVDVISNSMSNVRSLDESLEIVASFNIGKHIELKAPQAFSNGRAIEVFAEQVVQQIGYLISQREMYDEIYSRAMWPASHFAAALVKKKFPSVKWIAEFSDPLLKDVTGKDRYGQISLDWLKKQGFISEEVSNITDNLFYWCEKLVYDLADEIIFTNINQKDYMLSYFTEYKDRIEDIALISPQPTLSSEYYELSDIKLEKEEGLVYIGYFGSVYVNRGFDVFFRAWEELSSINRDRIKLLIYTQQSKDLVLKGIPNSLVNKVEILSYVDYISFLALTKQFDYLLVMDAQVESKNILNPYLPSKVSDYIGSNSSILALIEEYSPMSQINFKNLFRIKNSNSKKMIEFLEGNDTSNER